MISSDNKNNIRFSPMIVLLIVLLGKINDIKSFSEQRLGLPEKQFHIQ